MKKYMVIIFLVILHSPMHNTLWEPASSEAKQKDFDCHVEIRGCLKKHWSVF